MAGGLWCVVSEGWVRERRLAEGQVFCRRKLSEEEGIVPIPGQASTRRWGGGKGLCDPVMLRVVDVGTRVRFHGCFIGRVKHLKQKI